jgi:hypothetical protein
MPFPNKDTQFNSGEVAVKAQLKSAEARKMNTEKKKAFKKILDEEFEKLVKVNGDSDKQITRKEAVALRLMQIMLDPRTAEKDFIRAMEFARDTIGEKPVDKVLIGDVDQNTINEVEAMVRGELQQTTSPEKKDMTGKILKIEPETEKIVCTYKTAAMAAKENGIDPSNLSKAIKSGKIIGGFKWQKRKG